MALNLPIKESVELLKGIIEQLGADVTIDGVHTKIMVSDINHDYSRFNDHIKQATVLKEISFGRGSEVVFAKDGGSAIVITIPNDDIVSSSCKLLMCNGALSKVDKKVVYDENSGDILEETEVVVAEYPAFIQRKSGDEVLIDAGIGHEATVQAITSLSCDLSIGERVKVKGKHFRVSDIDDMTELTVVGLVSV